MRAFKGLFVSTSVIGLLGALLVATPAHAADATVSTLGELQTALADCATAPNTITLGADIIDTDAQLTIQCDTTIDLGPHDLTVSNVVIDAGHNLEITGPTDGSEGTLTAVSTVNALAAIRTTDATLRVTGGSIHATGAAYGSAIGGDTGESAGTLIVEDGAVHAVGGGSFTTAIGGGTAQSTPADGAGSGGTIQISGGSVYAETSGGYAAAVGGGSLGDGLGAGAGATITVTGGSLTAIATGVLSTAIGGGASSSDPASKGGSGGSLTIGPAGTVIASASRSAFGGGTGTSESRGPGDFGTLHVEGTLILPSGMLTVTENPDTAPAAEITVTSTGRIIGSVSDPSSGATIRGSYSSRTNDGHIQNDGIIALDAPLELVSGNARTITFDNGAPAINVFAPSLTEGSRELPALPSGSQWNTAADGSGHTFTGVSSTTGEGTIDLYAVHGYLEVSADPLDRVAVAGEPFVFPITVLDSFGTLFSPQPPITYTSSDCTIAPGNIFETAGTCTITALATGVSIPALDFTITVEPAALNELSIVASATTVDQGGSLDFTITGEDAFGNPVDASAAVLTSSVPTDVISGHTVTFVTASPHVITATLGTVTSSVTIEVRASGPQSPGIPRTGASGDQLMIAGAAGLVLLIAGGALLLLRRKQKK